MSLGGRLKPAIRGLLQRLGWELRRRPARPYPYRRRHRVGEHEFDFWIASDVGARWYDTDKWATDPEPRHLLSLARPGGRVLELGAHQGFFTVLLGLAVGEAGGVIAVEADPFNAMVAGSQLALNALAGRCEVVHAAAADHGGELRFGPGGQVETASDAEARLVPAVSGDELTRGGPPVTLLKVDVEGFEGKALAGCRELLAARPAIALELHHELLGRYGSSVGEILELIGADGYRGWVVTRGREEPFSPALIEAQRGREPRANLFLEPVD